MKAYDVKVRLDDFRPLYWRDIIIPSGITFKDLNNILKILWGFNGYHLYEFTFKDDFDAINESNDTLIDEFFENNGKIFWEYDFGDGWSFTIEVKKVIESDKDYPVIKRFKGEYELKDDIGGVWGLHKLIEENSDELSKFDLRFTQNRIEGYDRWF